MSLVVLAQWVWVLEHFSTHLTCKCLG
jgi:hypothetical protein